jgi:peptidoglycan/xylan/chitin deacetylase (PgdA/CDA1 family)
MRGSSLKHIIPRAVWDRARDFHYATREHGLVRSHLRSVVAGDPGTRRAAITFDDGPTPGETTLILDVLSKYGVPATFFLLGRNVVRYPEIVRAAVAAGHAIGNHTFDHPHLPSCSTGQVVREVRRCQQAIRNATGLSPSIMRPPYGAQDAATFLAVRAMGYEVVHWSASGQDWQGDPAVVVADRVLSAIAPGRIILLHDHLEPPPGQATWRDDQQSVRDRTPTAEALERIIVTLKADGYSFVTIPDMLRQGTPVRRSWFY